MAGCVFAYFAECTVVMPLFLLIAILRNVGALRGRLALAEEPTFHNVFRLPVNKSVPKKRSHVINKQRQPFWPFSSLTWCCGLLLHKYKTESLNGCINKKYSELQPTILHAFILPPKVIFGAILEMVTLKKIG